MITPRKTSEEYWAERMDLINDEVFNLTEDQEKELTLIYKQSAKDIKVRIESYYQKWADHNGLLDIKEAKKDLSNPEFAVWKKDIKSYYNDTQNIVDEEARKKATRLLDGLSLRSRINREQQLLYQIELELVRLKANEEVSILRHLMSLIQYGYKRVMYEISKGIGFLTSFAVLPKKQIDFIMTYNWQGSNWSKRLWKNHDTLATQVKEVLSKGFIKGTGIKQMSKELAERMDVSRYVSRRLIQTESVFVSGMGNAKAMSDTGFIDEYIFVATFDKKTSEICKSLHLQRFKLSERIAGKNAPAMHPFCRSVCIPVISNGIPTVRLARDAKGKNIQIPFDMSYQEYESKYLKTG